MKQQHAELGALFSFLDRPEISLHALIGHYANFHGGLNHGHQVKLIKQLRDAAEILDGPAAARFLDRDILREDGRITAGFLGRFAPDYLGAFYRDEREHEFTRATLLPASPNQWCCTDLPPPLNIRLGKSDRPGVDVLFGRGKSLFVAPYGHQWFDPASGGAWPIASSRAFPRSIEGHGTTDVDDPVAVIQDQFDGANFAHFLYDCIPRVLYLAERFPDFARRCLFLMGGEPGPYHALILGWVRSRHGLAASQFVFPKHYAIWRLAGEVAFFSDQVETITHPLHMCHPDTVGRVRDLLDPRALPTDTPERIYISREDAPGRKLLNEADLTGPLADRGYVTIRLTEHDPARQIALLANARHIVAPHGMGLTNLVYNRSGGTLVEIFNPRNGTDAYAFVARALGLEYRFCLGADQEGTFLGTIADVESVMAAVTEIDPGSSRPAPNALVSTRIHEDESAESIPEHPPIATQSSMLSDVDLVQQFESLGDNCEFGLVQRFLGAEPLGLFRFNFVPRNALIEMLDTDFRDADNPGDIEMRREGAAADGEWYVHHRRYAFRYHTFRHDVDPDPVRAQQLRVLSFLKDKLLADLRNPEKTFIRKGEASASEAADLLRRVRRHGPATLLWVAPQEEAYAPGTVRVIQPGLLQGYLDRFAPPTDAPDISPAWLTMLRNAHALRAGCCAPGTVIAPPPATRTTNLLRREYLFPRTANWWGVSHASVAAVDGFPPGLHRDSPVMKHCLSVETVPTTSALCGVTLQHGLQAGGPYVASMDVWIPDGEPFEQVGAVFNGLSATEVRNADLTRRDVWQRVWVAARASDEGRVNPSLFAIGKAGARLYSTAWQLEIGHAPSDYVSSRAGILPIVARRP